jgi:quinol monooxygenase YgiN
LSSGDDGVTRLHTGPSACAPAPRRGIGRFAAGHRDEASTVASVPSYRTPNSPPEAIMTIIVRAELRALAGKREDFTVLANALVDATNDEPGTLRYTWYSSNDPDEFIVLEEYADAQAALSHNEHCAELLQRIPALAEMTSVHVHGTLSAELQSWINSSPVAHSHPPLSRVEHDKRPIPEPAYGRIRRRTVLDGLINA